MTCERLKKPESMKAGEKQNHNNYEHSDEETIWQRVRFTLFSMMVSASIFAGYDVTSFYLGTTLVIGTQLRPALLFGSWRAWVYELTYPDAIIKLIEACYIKRHEENLIAEEECYRMLQEIMRSPELIKAISGSNLKGSTDPNLDMIDKNYPGNKEKIDHLERLERKGFDVAKLKQDLIQKCKVKSKKNETHDEYFPHI